MAPCGRRVRLTCSWETLELQFVSSLEIEPLIIYAFSVSPSFLAD